LQQQRHRVESATSDSGNGARWRYFQ